MTVTHYDRLRKRAKSLYASTRQMGVKDGTLHFNTPLESDLVLTSNDYLGLGKDKKTAQYVAEKLLQTGAGSVAASSLFDTEGRHDRGKAEELFATLMGAGGAYLTQSGFVANAGLVSQLAGPNDVVYLDSGVHASTFAGASASGAHTVRFAHNDLNDLRTQVSDYGTGVVFVESVYSTTGEYAPLNRLTTLCKDSGLTLVVDESHSLGTHGDLGSGLVKMLGLNDDVHFVTASLAKAFVTRAGIVTFPEEVGYYMRMWNWPAIFSSGLMPHEVVGLRHTMDRVIEGADRRERLREAHSLMREAVLDLGFKVPRGANIVSLPMGSRANLFKFVKQMERMYVFSSPFFFPATARNGSLYRMSINESVTSPQVYKVHRAITRVMKILD